MIRRTRELADEAGVSLPTFEAAWDELPDYLDASTFDVVFCVGNSLGHAEGATGRLSALAAMARLLNPGGRLVLNSRAWERVLDGGTRFDVRDRLVRRRGRDAVVVYHWQVAHSWEQEHHLQIVVAQIEADGSVLTCSERLSLWPFRFEELVVQLESVGLKVKTATFDSDGGGYEVIAVNA
jgi:SAM-dependent methyltransferase